MLSVKERLAAYRAQSGHLRKQEQCQVKDNAIEPVDTNGSQTETNRSTPASSTNKSTDDLFSVVLVEPTPWYIAGLKIFLWILLWGFFIEVEFGSVYLTASALFFIVYSLCGSRRKAGEPSAYSVFNKNCEAIDGTLTAEQFERELRYGPTSVKR